MGQHKADAESSPLLLIIAFVAVASVIAGVLWLAERGSGAGPQAVGTSSVAGEPTPSASANSGGPDRASSSATPDEEAAQRSRLLTDVKRVQPGQTIRPCEKVLSTEEITVVTYNIKAAGTGIGGISGILRSSGADIVMLQEVDRGRGRTSGMDQTSWLASDLGMEGVFGANHAEGGGYSGTAILSRFPIIESGNTYLPRPAGDQRGLLKAVVDIEGVAVSVYATHLQPAYDAAKYAQASTAASIISGDASSAILLGGDFNSTPSGTPYRMLQGPLDDTWAAVGSGAGFTHPSGGPNARIDWLMYGGENIRPTSASVIGVGASDHMPVRASYELSGISELVC
jgi:endonuclease/exonuclease/phosphatase family metal-dependent hydrolase